MRLLHILIALLTLGAAMPAAAAPVAVAPLAFTQRTLPNGLRVYALPDRTGSTVSVQMWYDVGSKDDPRGRSGFAHLFEHLMFKATRNMPAEQMDRLTEDVGGNNNASTDDDYTEFHETVPANHLERLLWAEAERMGSLVVDQAAFVSERAVVEEELRSDAARPYDNLFRLYLPQTGYAVHPYARPGIGNIAELDSASLDDVRAFHATYYRPDNAVLVVAGNFDPADLDRWVTRCFAPIASSKRAIPRVAAIEPARAAARRYTIYAPNTPLPAVVISWLLPPATDPDHAAINLIDAILSGGESARLYRSLVYRDQLAAEAGVSADLKTSTGLLAAYAIVAGGKSIDAGEAALRREIARLGQTPVTAEELARAKNQIVTSALKSRETAEGRASTLAASVIVERDPHAADRRLAEIEAVTPADIQRVARRLFAEDRAVTIHYLPETSRPKGAAGDAIAVAPTVVTAPLTTPPDVPIVVAASAATRVLPPAPGKAIAPVLPVPVERRLANGMRLAVIERHALPIVTAYLVVGGGSATDPADRAGLAELSADLLTKGTATRSATQIADAIESLGGSIGGDATRDGELLSLTVKSDQLMPAMDVFADVALHPAFAQAEIDRARAQVIDGLAVDYSTPGALAGLVAGRAVFGGGPYGSPGSGTPASLRATTRADVIAAHAAAWRPDSATLVLAGDITPDRAVALAESLFGGWTAPATPRPPAPAVPPAPAPRIIVVDLPQAPQAAVVVARQAIARGDPRYYPLLVANAALGGGYSARLNQEVRVKRGLAYGAGSSFAARRAPAAISAATQTKNPSVPEVIDLIAAEMRRMGTAPVPAAELAARKATLEGGFGRGIETTDGLAGLVAGLVLVQVDLAEIGRYTQSVEAITPAQIQAVSRELLDPAVASIVVVGDAASFLPALKAKGIAPEVIPAAAIDLDKPGLR